jgi:hypothetical protein
MHVVDEVTIIKVVPETMRGKYKIGQHLDKKTRLLLANLILKRNTPTAKNTVKTMGIKQTGNGLEISEDILW